MLKSLKFGLVIFLPLFIGGADGQELKKIKIGYPAISYNQIHIQRTWIPAFAGKTEGAVEFKSTLSKDPAFEPRVDNAIVGCETVTEVRS